MADRIVCMRAGRIEQVGTPDDLYLRPGEPVHRQLHRLAAGQPDPGRGRATAPSAPAASPSRPRARRAAASPSALRPEHLRFAGAGAARPHRPDRAHGPRDPLRGEDRRRPRAGARARLRGGARRGRAGAASASRPATRWSSTPRPNACCPAPGCVRRHDRRHRSGGGARRGRRAARADPAQVAHARGRAAAEAPFRPGNLALGWRLGASLEIDILATADQRFVVAHDATLGPSTTGRGRVAAHAARGHGRPPAPRRRGRRRPGRAGPVARRSRRAAPRAAPRRRAPACSSTSSCPRAAPSPRRPSPTPRRPSPAWSTRSSSARTHLDAARRLVAAMPGARLGYDPMRAASRDPGLARDPVRLLRHIERRRDGVALAYLRFDVVVAAEARGFPLVARLLDLGIETDAWTVNPGPGLQRRRPARAASRPGCARSPPTLRARSRAASRPSARAETSERRPP